MAAIVCSQRADHCGCELAVLLWQHHASQHSVRQEVCTVENGTSQQLSLANSQVRVKGKSESSSGGISELSEDSQASRLLCSAELCQSARCATVCDGEFGNVLVQILILLEP